MVTEHQPVVDQPSSHPSRWQRRERPGSSAVRVTFVVPELNLSTGGGSHYSFNLTTLGLHGLGIDVKAVVLETPRTADLADAPFPITVEQGWHRPTRTERLRVIADILRRHETDTDIIHVFDPELALAAGLYRARGRTPTVATLNSFTLWCTDLDQMDGECQRHCGLLERVRHARTSPLRKLMSLPVRVQEYVSVFPRLRHIDHFFPNSPVTQRLYREAG